MAVRAQLAGEWKLRLADLLEEFPEAVAELRDLVTQFRIDVPAGTTVSAAGHALAVGRDYSITASSGAIVAGTVIQGEVSPSVPFRPEPGPSW